MNEQPESSVAGRSPFWGMGLTLAAVLAVGWGVAIYRPFSFGWLGNPRGDGYLAAGCLIVDLTFEPDTNWSIQTPKSVPLNDLSDLDYSGYREESAWYRLRFTRVPDISGYHFIAGLPILMGLHLLGWGLLEMWWKKRLRKHANSSI
jgi:hypothetical protein